MLTTCNVNSGHRISKSADKTVRHCITLLVCVHFRQGASLFISGDIFLVTLSAGYISMLVGSSDFRDLIRELLIHLFNQFIQT